MYSAMKDSDHGEQMSGYFSPNANNSAEMAELAPFPFPTLHLLQVQQSLTSTLPPTYLASCLTITTLWQIQQAANQWYFLIFHWN